MIKLPSASLLPSSGLDRDMSAPVISAALDGSYAHADSSSIPSSAFSRTWAPDFDLDSRSRSPQTDASLRALPISSTQAYSYSSSAAYAGPSPPSHFRPSYAHFDTSPFHRSQSLSPTSTGSTNAPPHSAQHGNYSLASNMGGAGGASLSRSVSADAAAPQQTSTHLVQRLTQQNSLIREAWEAERNYLEANRRRAEEVYQEERAIMEDVRENWHNEKVDILSEMQSLRERIQSLQGENATLKAVVSQSAQASGVVSPLSSQRGGSRDVSTESSSSSAQAGPPNMGFAHHSPQQRAASNLSAIFLPPGLDGASRRPHFASPRSSHTSPTRQPEASSFSPLDPRTQPKISPPRDFLSPTFEVEESPVPIIDVQELDSKLEGIPIKATAVQRSTFSETSNASSPATSPPVNDAYKRKDNRPVVVKRVSSKDQTIQVLAAEESRRRTMHAGHTPNHSLSLFPTITPTEGNSSTRRGDGTTPTASTVSASRGLEADHLTAAYKHNKPDAATHQHADESNNKAELHNDIDDFEEGRLEPTDDVPLKGPLMVKNIPAQDEIFWAQVNKKLEPISHGHNALPTVMQDALEDTEPDAGPSGVDATGQGRSLPAVGGDASHDESEKEGKASIEPDVKLKFKSSSNFGAPFGVL